MSIVSIAVGLGKGRCEVLAGRGRLELGFGGQTQRLKKRPCLD